MVPSFPTRPSKATMKLRKERSSSQGAVVGSPGGMLPDSVQGSVPKKPSTPVAPPVHAAVGRQAAQGLGRHRPLHGMEGRRRRQDRRRGLVVGRRRRPGRPGSRPGCRSRRRCGSSSTRPRRCPRCWRRRRGRGGRPRRPGAPGCGGSGSRAWPSSRLITETSCRSAQHVEPVVGLVEHEAARAAAHVDVVRALDGGVEVGLEARVLDVGSCRRRRSWPSRRPPCRSCCRRSRRRLERRRQAVVDLALGRRGRGSHVRCGASRSRCAGSGAGDRPGPPGVDHRDARLGEVALDRAAAVVARVPRSPRGWEARCW